MKHISLKPLVKTLQRTCDLLAQSEEVAWSPLTPNEVRSNLSAAVDDILSGKEFDRIAVRVEFAPTSTVQEIAMANGWHEEYLRLASVVDRLSR